MSKTNLNKGYVTQIIGPVLDIKFSDSFLIIRGFKPLRPFCSVFFSRLSADAGGKINLKCSDLMTKAARLSFSSCMTCAIPFKWHSCP